MSATQTGHSSTKNPHECYGLLAEFEHANELIDATRRARELGYERMDAYAPFPVEGLPEELGRSRTRVPLVTFLCGIVGGVTGYMLQYYSAVIDYPLNVGGRPLHSWPSFVPITFELTVLFAGLGAFVGMFALNRLPKPYHPVFNVPAFLRASQDRFFLCLQAADPRFDHEETRDFLESLNPIAVHPVDP